MKDKILDVGTMSLTYIHESGMKTGKTRNHCHEKYEILYVVNGTGRCVIEGTKYEVCPGTLFVLPPLSYHAITIFEGEIYESYLLKFSLDDISSDVEKYFSLFDLSDRNDGYFCTHGVNNAEIVKLIYRLQEPVSLPGYEKKQYYRLLLSQIILYIALSDKRDLYEHEGELGARVIRYLGQCVNKNISLEYLAKHFFVSKYYLCRAFKKYNGISVHGYINQKRVMYAKGLIEKGESASSVAYRVGYSDYSAFYRAYVKVIGKSPTEKEKEGAV